MTETKTETKKKLTINKELCVFNDFVVVNVFDKGDKRFLLTIKHAYKPKEADQWKSTDFIGAQKIDKIIESLQEVKKKIEESK